MLAPQACLTSANCLRLPLSPHARIHPMTSQPPEKDCKKMQLLVSNLHIARPKGGGMRDVGLCCPLQGSRESQLPVPLPHHPNPLSFLCQIPWDWSCSGLRLGI